MSEMNDSGDEHAARQSPMDEQGFVCCALCDRNCSEQHTVVAMGQTILYVACPDCAGDFRVAFANVLGSIRRERHHERSMKGLG